MNEIQKEINILSKYFGRQIFIWDCIYTIDNCWVTIDKSMMIIESGFVAYRMCNGNRRYANDLTVETVMKRLIEVF